MGKEWKRVATNALEAFTESTKEERIKRYKSFDNAIRNTEIKKEDVLVDESLKAHKKRIAYEDQLIKASEDGILKSEKLKEEVKEILSERNRKNKRKKYYTWNDKNSRI